MPSTMEYQESSSTTFEWTLKGLRNIFDSSRGETKSRVIRSVRFGGGKWQILFYPNSGEGNFISLYLNCEPTQEEKENAINGRWVREGLFKFSFELRNTNRTTLFNQKEASDHTFTHRTPNWGWAQFAKRDAVYFASSAVRQSDTFVVVCTITSSPTPPTLTPREPKRPVPMGLLDVVGGLLDDPAYSDVEFVFPPRSGGRGERAGRKIWACKRLLTRVEYFESMFNSGFLENSPPGPQTDILPPYRPFASFSGPDSPLSDGIYHPSLEDSDEEEEFAEEMSTVCEESAEEEKVETAKAKCGDEPVGDVSARGETVGATKDGEAAENEAIEPREGAERPQGAVTVPGPPKVPVVVTDVAYTTYRAVLYYLYTDTIIFAPLSSSFKFLPRGRRYALAQSRRTGAHADPAQGTPPVAREGRGGEESVATAGLHASGGSGASLGGNAVNRGPQGVSHPDSQASTTRSLWIKSWAEENPGRPLPCSAKAVYRLADKLDLTELKERAREHILKSLTVTNVPHEVFSSFSAAFEEIRKVQIDFFLANWGEIRSSEAMRGVWQQIRNGRHPGFEEVWPVIAQNLEFRVPAGEGAVGDGQEA